MKDLSIVNQRNLARHILYKIRSVPVDRTDPMAAVDEMKRLAGPFFVESLKRQHEMDEASQTYRRINLCHSEEGSRLPLYTLFVYLIYKGGNHLQFGLGYESRDELQRVHVPSEIEHLENLPWIMERLDAQGLILKTGKLKEFFGDRNILILVRDDNGKPPVCPADGERLADPYIRVGDEFATHWEAILHNITESQNPVCPKS